MPEINGLYEELKSLMEKYGLQATPSPAPNPEPVPVPEPPAPAPEPITFKDGEYHGI